MAWRTIEEDLGEAVVGRGPGDGEVVPAAVTLHHPGCVAVVEGRGAALLQRILHARGRTGILRGWMSLSLRLMRLRASAACIAHPSKYPEMIVRWQ